MMKIGEFAGLTGLSVKALRHYDETGVIVPAEVDLRSSYRSYDEGQVRAGVLVRALRDAGVPLPAVAAAVAGSRHSGGAEEALERYRREMLEQREREDRAFRDASVVLRALTAPVSVTERSMPAQPYVGQAIAVPLDGAEVRTDDDANEVFAALYARIQQAGLGPSGSFWTALRPGDERDTVEIVCCWPVHAASVAHPDGGPLGPDVFAAELPARTELVATWRPTSGEELPEGVLHPAVVALFDAVSERDVVLSGGSEVRQAVLGHGEDDFAVEVSITVRSD
ncbi:MerR family transcriptional regulator [Herbiconiux sp. A18JL235]|uniref:MerR family transcriptional regulator n=1 Tax=Herbiconiux sp. A18JL235 TaxID=3152363 RepID=A0AB39BGZ2_9MICO